MDIYRKNFSVLWKYDLIHGKIGKENHYLLIDENDMTTIWRLKLGSKWTITLRNSQRSSLSVSAAAAEAAARAAREAVREHKKQELREKWDERIENLKAKFQRNDK